MSRRIEVQEREESRTFIVQWYRDGQRVNILFLTAALCAEIVNRLTFDPDDALWHHSDVDVDDIASAIDEEIADEQRKLSEATAYLR